MYEDEPEFVTHCQRRLAAKFQFIDLLTETEMHIHFLIRSAQGDEAPALFLNLFLYLFLFLYL